MNLFVRSYGNEESTQLIVFLHGGGVSSWMWKYQLDDFKKFHCITIDLLEHGRSGGEFTIKNCANEIVNYLTSYYLHKEINMIGFSLGSQVLLEILQQKPNLVTRAMINSALVQPINIPMKILSYSIRLMFPLIQYRSFAKLQAKELYINEDLFETYFEESRLIKAETLIRVLEENNGYSISNNEGNSSTQLLITVGEKEKRVMHKSVKKIVSVYTNSDTYIFQGIAHGAPLASPKIFNEVLLSWLQEKII